MTTTGGVGVYDRVLALGGGDRDLLRGMRGGDGDFDFAAGIGDLSCSLRDCPGCIEEFLEISIISFPLAYGIA